MIPVKKIKGKEFMPGGLVQPISSLTKLKAVPTPLTRNGVHRPLPQP